MIKSVKIIVYVVIGFCVLLVVGIIGGAFYMFAYALDTEFEHGASAEVPEINPGSPEEWLVQSGQLKSIESHDGLNLKAYFIPAPTPTKKYALLIHGYKAGPTGMAHYALRYHQQGWNILVPHHRAHGESEGRYIGMGGLESQDMLGWLSLIIGLDPNADVLLHGVSMGAATTMLLTGSKSLPVNVRASVADCGYTTLTDEFTHQLKELFGLPPFPLIPLTSLVTKIRANYFFSEVDCLAAVAQSSTPTLFIHGEEDGFVPFEMLDEIYNVAACPKDIFVVAGAGHAKSREKDPESYWKRVDSFLNSYF